jgi:hypothetical protein
LKAAWPPACLHACKLASQLAADANSPTEQPPCMLSSGEQPMPSLADHT